MLRVLKKVDNPFHYTSIPEMKFVLGDFNDVSIFDPSLIFLLLTLCFAIQHVLKMI